MGLRICIFGNLGCRDVALVWRVWNALFSGGIVFVDVLEVLDATLSRFFSLTTERVSFTLCRRNILRLYYSLFADARAERPYIADYTLLLCIVFGGLLRCRFGVGSTHCEWVFGMGNEE